MNQRIPSPNLHSLIGSSLYRNKTVWVLLILGFLNIIFLLFPLSLWENEPKDILAFPQTNKEYHVACPYHHAMYQNLPVTQADAAKIEAVVVPHHLLARDLIGQALSKISPDYDTIIVVGPNHFDSGIYPVQTSLFPWKTDAGMLLPAIPLTSILTKQQLTTVYEDSFDNEHAICGEVSFIKHYFPHATVVPLILKSNVTNEEIDNLATVLGSSCSNCLLLASVDFTHEQSHEEAITNDKISTQVLENLKLEDINRLTVDSPATIRLVLSYVTLKGVHKGNMVNRSDSYEIAKIHPESVTSYITVLFNE